MTVAHCASYNIFLTLVNRTIKYDLHATEVYIGLVCCRRPQPGSPGSYLIVLVLSFFFIRVTRTGNRRLPLDHV